MKTPRAFILITGWLALLAAFTPVAFASETAGTHVVSGRVVNRATGQYLEGAQVQVVGSDRSALTTRMGYFELGGLPAGAQQLSISYAGLDP
ncbi:MAG: carboxypeptidase-like regulatory domain-containing protein [Verrucomicrobia bacterium]|nr:carboxypeptidase-like regulatory domain-containing protein [Verrucomicrobiota bacterium]